MGLGFRVRVRVRVRVRMRVRVRVRVGSRVRASKAVAPGGGSFEIRSLMEIAASRTRATAAWPRQGAHV